MDIDADIRIAIRKGLLSAFRGRSDFDRMVRQGLSKNLNEIAAEKVGLDATVDALLTWAESEDRVPALLLAPRTRRTLATSSCLPQFGCLPNRCCASKGWSFGSPPPHPHFRNVRIPCSNRIPTRPRSPAATDAEVLDELRLPLVLCLHGASGAGKSSFLQAGVLPRLRSDGVPVVVNRRPDEPGIARRLAAGLLELPEGSRLGDEDLQGFVHLLGQVEKLASTAPVIVLDQFEDALLRRSEDGSALARACSAGRHHRARNAGWTRVPLPMGAELSPRVSRSSRGLAARMCRAMPARESAPVFRSCRTISRQDYLREMPLGPLGVASSEDEAKAVFLRAIKVPLALADEKSGALRYLRLSSTYHQKIADDC